MAYFIDVISNFPTYSIFLSILKTKNLFCIEISKNCKVIVAISLNLHMISFLLHRKIVFYDLFYGNFQILTLDLTTVLSNSKLNTLVHP